MYLSSFVKHYSSFTPYLARSFINIHSPKDFSSPPWMLSENMKYSKILFGKPIIAHPIQVAHTMNSYNASRIPQIAVVGVSNVGKSSLLNALLHGRETINSSVNYKRNSELINLPLYAPISRNPGRTRHLFTFDLSDHLSLVDLPGYGYAKVPKQIQNDWAMLIEEYLNRAKSLKRVLSLLNCTEGFTDLDVRLWEMLIEKKINFQLVLTKVDLLKPLELHSMMLRVITTIRVYDSESIIWPYIHAVSSRNFLGIEELRCSLACIAADNRRALNKSLIKSYETEPVRQHR